MDEYPLAPPSFPELRPSSNIDNKEKNQDSYVKPPSHSDFVPTRPVSNVEDQQHDLMADDVPGEKLPPSFPQQRPSSNTDNKEENQDSYVKPPSHSDFVPIRPGSDVEGTSVYENTVENPPSFGAVRPPNVSSEDKDNNTRPLSYRR